MWDRVREVWYFSMVIIVRILIDSPNPNKFLSDLKLSLKKEGSELTANFSQLKLQAVLTRFISRM